MAEIAILGSKVAFLTKPEFFGKNILSSKHFWVPMIIYITIVKHCVILVITCSKISCFGYFLLELWPQAAEKIWQRRHLGTLAGNTARQWLLIVVSHVALYQGWRTCGPQKNFVRPAKHSGETSSLELLHSGETSSLELTAFIVWLNSCAARLLSGNWQSGPR